MAKDEKSIIIYKTIKTLICGTSLIIPYPVLGEKEESKVSFRPRASCKGKKTFVIIVQKATRKR